MRPWSAFAIGAAWLAGCSGASPSSGQTAFMVVQGGPNVQYIPGPIDTTGTISTPVVHMVSTAANDLYPRIASKSISGTVGPGSTAVMIGLLGDTGHWVMPVQDQDQTTTGDFTFSCTAAFSSATPTGDGGAITLVVRATDKDGNIGPAKLQDQTLESWTPPTGSLVISLDWDTEADLDLHVVLPSASDAGVNEIWSRKPSGLASGTSGATVDQGMASGYLDLDSNCQCVIDGRRIENVIFPSAPASGQYIVRVDTFSLCSEVTARWHLQVYNNGVAVPSLVAYGQSTDTDTRYAHGQGAGVTALVFDYEQ